MRTWLTDDPQEAVWAARQVYEAADYAAQAELGENGADFAAPGVAAQLTRNPIVIAAVDVITSDLHLAEQENVDMVRQRCQAEAAEFAALFR